MFFCIRAWFASAGTLTPFRGGDSLGVLLSRIEIPKAELQKGLKSGFTTTVVFQLKLTHGKQAAFSKEYIFGVFYDLWDEVFLSSLSSGASGKESRVFRSSDEVLAWLESIKLFPIEKISVLNPATSYSLEVTVLLDPIQKDRAEVIRKWVSENNVNTGISPAQGNGSGAPNPGQGQIGSMSSNRIMGALFSEYLSEGLSSTKWKTTVRSKEFRITALHD